MEEAGEGWIIIKGQGIGKTILLDTEYETDGLVTFRAHKPHRLKFTGFSLYGERITSSQGTIVEIDTKYVDIKIDKGFPEPSDLYQTETTAANKIRLIDDDDAANPRFVEDENNDHYSNRVTWFGPDRGSPPYRLSKGIWRFFPIKATPFKVGDRIAISSKSKQTQWGRFSGGGSDLVFESIQLKRLGRIKFLQKIDESWNNIKFTNVSIIKFEVDGMTSFYSTDAGPQLGSAGKAGNIYNLIVNNCSFENTVDDGIAFQNVQSGMISNNIWRNTGGVLVADNSGDNLKFQNNQFYHSPVEDQRPGNGDFKGVYNNSHRIDGTKVHLNWNEASRAQTYKIYFGDKESRPLIDVQHETSKTVEGLEHGKEYFWKVDAYNEKYGTNIGDWHSFKVNKN